MSASAPLRVALFDLDHTLIAFDSGAAFTRHLIGQGHLDAGFAPRYEAMGRRYLAGDIDIREMHALLVGEVSHHPPETLHAWVREAAGAMAARVTPAARALVRSHQERGHACALVTATPRFIAEGFAHLVGLDDVLATEPERDATGRYTGRVVGEPCFREYKIAHVEAWLARRGATWAGLERSWFYSDSMHDLPLLAKVTDPTAVDPDPALRQEALARGWPILNLSGAA